jgi:hypothetical protein
MNNAIRTRFDVFNKGEEPLTPPQPDVIDLTKREVEEDLDALTRFCDTAGERIDD